jgi:WhiB family redox-sensing transcriptional regulator
MKTMDDNSDFSIFDAPVLEERPWAVYAACRDEQGMTFFPQSKADEAIALTICGICPVRAECLDHALDTNERFGVWGGTTEKGRRKLSRIG